MGPGASLALKLVLTPVLVGAASLAGRRWGAGVSGWLLGIPFTSAPVAFFLALGLGTRFAAAAAAGTMVGAASQAAFCLAYAWIARRGASLSLLAATLAFLAVTAVFAYFVPPLPLAFAAMMVVLAVALMAIPRGDEVRGHEAGDFPLWDIPARMVVATVFVVLLTGAAPLLGARLAGLVAPFPLYAAVLAVFAHRMRGATPAIGVVRGLVLGLFAFAVFFFALSELIDPYGIAVAFAVAIGLALAVQAASLTLGRRMGIA